MAFMKGRTAASCVGPCNVALSISCGLPLPSALDGPQARVDEHGTCRGAVSALPAAAAARDVGALVMTSWNFAPAFIARPAYCSSVLYGSGMRCVAARVSGPPEVLAR